MAGSFNLSRMIVLHVRLKNKSRLSHASGSGAGAGTQASIAAELKVVFESVHDALSRATTEWNSQHDPLRNLPLEIAVYCWSFLDTPCLVSATAVCRNWRRILLNAPALWSTLEFHSRKPAHYKGLGVLLQRSGDLKLSLSVRLTFDAYKHHTQLSVVLQNHAHRLHKLDTSGSYFDPDYYYYGHDQYLVLGFEAPALRSFTSDNSSFVFRSSAFRTSCQSLQHLRLANTPAFDGMPLPSVASLTFKHYDKPLDKLFASFPRLVRLQITGSSLDHPPSLPRGVPPPDTLQHVILRNVNVSYSDISSFGFARLRNLEVHGCELDVSFALFLRLGLVAHTVSIQGSLISLRSQPADAGQPGSPCRTVCVSFPIHEARDYNTVLDHPSICGNIKMLLFFPETRCGRALPSAEFPALQTFILPVRSPFHPLFIPPDMEHYGRLRAPALRCLVIAYAADAALYPVGSISPAHLALFVARHLELAPGRTLDELVLEQPGIRLDENEDEYDHGLEVLESYVGTIRVMSADSISTLA
ncbi:hypothetical protein AURDEDRAFT_187919 [Auricularia subglabra TFB-10046 SS5]|uniref:F-box domain-containing protein n=1 Tax=Auricularia subglabra (strain TFB-10046 / SS5) TaxID=717982 RepID=J0LI80_AURST|nr:hypothetical protein AURDEDRAFT_187919 [Auricularia subglabra TFB-10046 SS5]